MFLLRYFTICIRIFPISIICFALISCSQSNENQASEEPKPRTSPVVQQNKSVQSDTIKFPIVIQLDSRPKPKTFIIPVAGANHFSIPKNGESGVLNLEPPNTVLLSSEVTEEQSCGFFTNYTTDQGLALDGIHCGFKDNIGNLWFGTTGGGLSCYNGKSFTNYTTSQGLANNVVTCINQDKKGNLWIATLGGGISCYDGKSFTNFTTAQGLASNDVRCITEDNNGNLWFGTAGGGASRLNTSRINQINEQLFTNYTTAQGLANDDVWCIMEDRARNLWFGTAGGGVSCFNPSSSAKGRKTSFTNYSEEQGLANNYIFCITEDQKGNLWFGTYKGGVSFFDGKSFINFTEDDGLANNTILCIREDKSGSLWLGTADGVCRYNPPVANTFEKKLFVNLQGLDNNTIWSITEDNTGNLWLGSAVGGIWRYDGKSFTCFTTEQGLSHNTVRCILEDYKGNLWFGTGGGGISCYDGKSFTNYTVSQGLCNNVIYCICEDRNGNIWMGSDGGGISCYNGKSFINISTEQGLISNNVKCITEDRKRNLWIGTEEGISCFNGKSFTNFTKETGLANNDIRCIHEDKYGTIWIATNGGGVSFFDGVSFFNINTSLGLNSNNIRCIYEDIAGNIWFGSAGGGISILNGLKISFIRKNHLLNNKLQQYSNLIINSVKKNNEFLFKNLTTKDGLADNMIYGIIDDKQNNIIIGTNLGFTILVPTQNENTKNVNLINLNQNYKIKVYNIKTGYPVKDINGGTNNNGAMLCDKKGIIWAGTGSDKTALVRFDMFALHESNAPPIIRLQNIKVNNENVCWYDLMNNKKDKKQKIDSLAILNEEFFTFGRELHESERDTMRRKFHDILFDSISPFYPIPKKLVLPYKHNNLSFEFAAIEPARPSLVKYQYLLENYDDEWSPVTQKTSASYGNIHEGEYSFKIKACSPDGVWNEPIIFQFKVLPPWYRTVPAYICYAILFFLSLWGFIRWNTRRLRKEKEYLEQVIKKRTAEVVEQKEYAEQQKLLADVERKKSDDLLLNILPDETANELKSTGHTIPRNYGMATVLFTDFMKFTQFSEKMSPPELLEELNYCFTKYDEIISQHNIEKIKTIGDSYMCAGGLPVPNTTNPIDVVLAALKIQSFMSEYRAIRETQHRPFFEIRIGIHTGTIIAGVVGIKKFAYDIWGDTVNIASRMESSGVPGKINISDATYYLINNYFICSQFRTVTVKNDKELKACFVERLRPEYSDDESGFIQNDTLKKMLTYKV